MSEASRTPAPTDPPPAAGAEHGCLADDEALQVFLRLRASWPTRQRGPLAAALVAAGHRTPLAQLAATLPPPEPAVVRLAARQLRALRMTGGRCLLACCLPPWLAEAPDLPAALFVRGSASLLWRRGWGIVGSRAAQPAAQRFAAAMAGQLPAPGQVVISGGARGIDGAAHRGAMAAGVPTVAYLGVPADQIYPAAHRRLFGELLAAGGALVAELPPAVPAPAYWHARRNRLIAAHAHSLLVVEAAAGSGSLGTAQAARRLGRPVRVAPPSVGGERVGLEALVAAGHAQLLLASEHHGTLPNGPGRP